MRGSVLMNPAGGCRAWITIDNGQNVTIHGETNIGAFRPALAPRPS
jgi:hypothetical protein